MFANLKSVDEVLRKKQASVSVVEGGGNNLLRARECGDHYVTINVLDELISCYLRFHPSPTPAWQ